VRVPLTFDTGALLALERRRQRVIDVFVRATEFRVYPKSRSFCR
jgi:hypothetical protein